MHGVTSVHTWVSITPRMDLPYSIGGYRQLHAWIPGGPSVDIVIPTDGFANCHKSISLLVGLKSHIPINECMRIELRYILILLLFLCMKGSFAQDKTTDSLKLALKNAKHDTTRCNILNALIELENDNKVWSVYNDQLLKLAEKGIKDPSLKLVYTEHLATAINNLGFLASQNGDSPKALEYYNRSLKLHMDIKNKEGIALALNNIGNIYDNNGDVAKAMHYYQKSLKIHEEIGNKDGIATTLNNIAYFFSQHGDISKALEYYQKSLKLQEEINNRSEAATVLNNIGMIYDNLGDIQKALDYHSRSLKIKKEINDKEGIALSLNNIGTIYTNQGDIPKALDYFHKSLKLQEEIGNKSGIARSLNNIGFIYDNQGDAQKALEYYQKSLKIREEINYKDGIAQSLNNIGYQYYKQRKLETALDYYNRSLKIHEDIKDMVGLATTLSNIGLIYELKGDLVKTKCNSLFVHDLFPDLQEYYEKSLKIREEVMDKEGIAFSLEGLADIMLQKGNVAGASDYAKRSLAISKELGYPDNIENAAIILKKVYEKQNKYKEALEMYALEIQMRDSMNNTETRKASIRKQFQYQYEKMAAADSVKNAEEQKVKNALLAAQHAQLKQEKVQRFALYGGLILVIAFLGFVFNRFRITQKQKAIIENQKELVDEAYGKLHEKNKEVMDSINYAKRIQNSMLTSELYIEKHLNRLMKK